MRNIANRQKLITKKLKKQIPELKEDEEYIKDDSPVPVHFVQPTTNWNWYVLAYDGGDTFFGLVDGEAREYGFFTLSELQSYEDPLLKLGVERDKTWDPETTLEEVEKSLE